MQTSLISLFTIYLAFLSFNLERHSTNGECQNTPICNNGGRVRDCKCDCFKNWSGDNCQNLNCAVDEPQTCSYNAEAFSKLCDNVPTIRNHCPKLCKLCSSTATATTTTTTTATATTTTTTTANCATTTDTAAYCSSLTLDFLRTYCSEPSLSNVW